MKTSSPSTNHPKFVVVGHPNKGKSSIVSTLTLNDTVQISDTPGTTKKSRSFVLKQDDKIYYELIDTPGFQRSRKVLKYLKSFGDVEAQKRPELLKNFLDEYEDDERFIDEVELIRPIVEGAGIIYVVDASKPYSNEYEAQMEILRYSAQPSMAILNYIGEDDYTKEWDMVLGQYFRLVKKFDPLNSEFSDHIDLLEAMSHLYEPWQKSMKEAIALLSDYNKTTINSISKLISQLMADALSLSITKKIYSSSKMVQDELKGEFQLSLKSLEQNFQKAVLEKLSFTNLDYKIEDKTLEYDLFSEQSRDIFGLSRERLILISTTSGALMGTGVDALLGGASLLLGTVIGGIIGAGSAIYGYEELAKIKFISTNKMKIGPIKDINFGFILLNRALIFTIKLLHKTHADRKEEFFKYDKEFLEELIDSKTLRELEKLHIKFKKEDIKENIEQYVKIVTLLLKIKVKVKAGYADT